MADTFQHYQSGRIPITYLFERSALTNKPGIHLSTSGITLMHSLLNNLIMELADRFGHTLSTSPPHKTVPRRKKLKTEMEHDRMHPPVKRQRSSTSWFPPPGQNHRFQPNRSISTMTSPLVETRGTQTHALSPTFRTYVPPVPVVPDRPDPPPVSNQQEKKIEVKDQTDPLPIIPLVSYLSDNEDLDNATEEVLYQMALQSMRLRHQTDTIVSTQNVSEVPVVMVSEESMDTEISTHEVCDNITTFMEQTEKSSAADTSHEDVEISIHPGEDTDSL